MAKSLGALEMVLLGDSALGTCSKVTAVGRMRAERRTTAKPWGPWKAQQFPGCTSGWRGEKMNQHEIPSLAWLTREGGHTPVCSALLLAHLENDTG